MDYSTLLNNRQLEAVESDSQYLRIIAGAGSGKTRVLTYRICYLISERGVDPRDILAFSFTNKVAKEMSERAMGLLAQVMPGRDPHLRISTFHSFCAKFLRMECRHLGYPASYTIYDEDDQKKLIKAIAESKGIKKGDDVVKKAIQYIGKMKTKGVYPQDISIDRESFTDEKICWEFYSEYEARKEQAFAFDFDDLLNKTIEILEHEPLVREHWANRYRHILVDEFQDTNDVQYKLLKLLLTPYTHLYVVGDPDQTIYTWRNANMRLILDFDRDFSGAETIILNENYRSTSEILDAANRLIAHNKKRVPKDLFTNQGQGQRIEVKVSMNDVREAEWVAREISNLAYQNRNDKGEPTYNNIAILYRSSYMTRPFEQSLKDSGIPYRIFGGLRFYERMEIKDLLAYFNLMYNSRDNVAFERIVNVPKRGIGDRSIAILRQESLDKGLSEYDYLLDISKYYETTELKTKTLNILGELIASMEAAKAKIAEGVESYLGVLKDFVSDIGYIEYLAEIQEVDEDRIGNVNSLWDDISHFIERNPDAPFEEYLQNVSLLTAQDDMDTGNYVSLMTIHTAKGLEFDNVFVISMNEGAFPSQRSVIEGGNDSLEEERRLAYVAFTRAKKRLFLSANTGYSFQTDGHSVPSAFFQEAGLKVPTQNEFSSMSTAKWGSSSRFQGGYSSSNRDRNSFFSDGDAISPFEPKKPEPKPEAKKSNGITDWKVGERVEHAKFGLGTLTEIVSDAIIVVNFDTAGRKTLLANHPMLSRPVSKGGQA